jgi:hypothetical protein
VIDPVADDVWMMGREELKTYEEGHFLWAEGVLGPDQRIYCAPLSGNAVLVIDPKAGTVSTIGRLGKERFKWNHGALGPDGRIYCSPAMNHSVGLLVIEPPGFGWLPSLSKFFPRAFIRVLRLLLLIRQRRPPCSAWGCLPQDLLIDKIFVYFQRSWFS